MYGRRRLNPRRDGKARGNRRDGKRFSSTLLMYVPRRGGRGGEDRNVFSSENRGSGPVKLRGRARTVVRERTRMTVNVENVYRGSGDD